MNDFAWEIAIQKAKQANSKAGSRNTSISVSMSGKPVIKLKRNKESRKQQEAKDEEFVRKLIAMESEQQLQEEKHRRRRQKHKEKKMQSMYVN